MREENRYLGLEIFSTYLLLCAAVILLREALSFLSLLIIAVLSCGFLTSWLRRKTTSRLTQVLIQVSVLGVFIWLAYSLLNSSLMYRDVITLWIKGALILVAVFSFNSAAAGFLDYIQCFSLPVFMTFPTLLGEYDALAVVSIFGYIVLWVLVLRLKFYGLFGAYLSSEKGVRPGYTNILLPGALLLSVALSWLAFANFSLPSLKKGGLFYMSGPGVEAGFDALEKEYYQLQDELQTQITRLIPGFETADIQHQILALLASLLKESPDVDVMEVERARQGLISRFKTPGPGLEKGEGEGETYLIQKYLEKKISWTLSQTKEEMADALKKNPFNLPERISISRRIKGMLSADSYRDLLSQEAQLTDKIKSAPLGDNEKRELSKLSARLKEWKAYELYYRKLDALSQKGDSFRPEARPQFYDLLGAIEEMDSPATFQQISTNIAQLEGKTSQQFNEIIAELKELLSLKLEMSFFQKQMRLREKIENAGLPRNKMEELEYRLDKIKDIDQQHKLAEESSALKEEAERYEIELGQEMKDLTVSQAQIAERKREVKLENLALAQERLKEKKSRITQYKEKAKAALKKIAFFSEVIIAVLFFGLLVTFFLLSLAVAQRRKEFLLLFERSPQDFIKALYDNTREILAILGARSDSVLAPLSYAEFVEARYPGKDRLFLLFTIQYEEARYSRHILGSQDSLLALNYYNNLLRNVFAGYSPPAVFFRYLSLLFFRKPLYIVKK